MSGEAMTKRQIAEQNFLDGYNCTQAVVAAFADELGVDKDTLIKIASSFGGGFGRLREVCGAVSAMGIIVGLVEGCDFSKAGQDAKSAQYAAVHRLAGEFKDINGSIICRELLGLLEREDSARPERRTEEYYAARPCSRLVASAARIIEENLLFTDEEKCHTIASDI